MNKYYVGSLYRFGYDLMAVGKSEKDVKAVIMAEYKKTYKKWNDGEKPSRDTLASAQSDIEIDEFTDGVVVWR